MITLSTTPPRPPTDAQTANGGGDWGGYVDSDNDSSFSDNDFYEEVHFDGENGGNGDMETAGGGGDMTPAVSTSSGEVSGTQRNAEDSCVEDTTEVVAAPTPTAPVHAAPPQQPQQPLHMPQPPQMPQPMATMQLLHHVADAAAVPLALSPPPPPPQQQQQQPEEEEEEGGGRRRSRPRALRR